MSAPHKSASPVAAGLVAPSAATAKDFATVTAKFAIKGHVLQRNVRADDGCVMFTVSRWGQSRSFTHWNDVYAFLAQIQIGGAT
ncbi:hypothetical protein FB547_1094 [Variovorax beijingensis]|uniref:Uncharacterized protein n=1 Tax=Variovorax beijingensis TaxID=2496117 RepID=A0A561BF28_9BURK|nr:hypothetical protein [Variovorax beijingensis]TWD77470.1 hypothetical protein FB547_1094 [Variovorax beijingensis]